MSEFSQFSLTSLKKLQIVDGKNVRCTSNTDIVGIYNAKKNKIIFNGEEYSITKFLSDVLKIQSRKNVHLLLECEIELGKWVKVEELFAAEGLRPSELISPGILFIRTHGIRSITELHSHIDLKFDVEHIRNLNGGTAAKPPLLLRVCPRPVQAGQRLERVDALEFADTPEAYIRELITHVQVGSRSVRPFFSSSLSTSVIQHYSCGFLRPIISIDTVKVAPRSLYVGGRPGNVLFSSNGTPINFARSSDEVIVDRYLDPDEYLPVLPTFRQRKIFSSPQNYRPPPLQELYDHNSPTGIFDLNKTCGVVMLTHRNGKKYVVKIGRGDVPDLHIQNEFLAYVCYYALNINVPDCALISYDVTLHCGSTEIHSTNVWYLVHDFVEGGQLQLDDNHQLQNFSKEIFADIILRNFDVLGPNLTNIIVVGQKMFRIDANGALLYSPDGKSRSTDRSSCSHVLSTLDSQIAQDIEKFKEDGNMGNQQLFNKVDKQWHMMRISVLLEYMTRMLNNFDSIISQFTSRIDMLPGWANVIYLIKRRLRQFCLSLQDPNSAVINAIRPPSEVQPLFEPPTLPIRPHIENCIIIASNRTRATIAAKYPGYEVIDVTSKGKDGNEYITLSPFCDYEDIGCRPAFEVPFRTERSFSVEGVWQGLKVFQNESIDVKKFQNRSKKDFKRKETAARGKILGHFGGEGCDMLNYIEARRQIYVPTYNFMLDNYAKEIMKTLYDLHLRKDIVLIDYFVNDDIENIAKPLSHASLIKKRLHEMFRSQFGIIEEQPDVVIPVCRVKRRPIAPAVDDDAADQKSQKTVSAVCAGKTFTFFKDFKDPNLAEAIISAGGSILTSSSIPTQTKAVVVYKTYNNVTRGEFVISKVDLMSQLKSGMSSRSSSSSSNSSSLNDFILEDRQLHPNVITVNSTLNSHGGSARMTDEVQLLPHQVLGDIPFGIRPRLKCCKCETKTRRVCGSCKSIRVCNKHNICVECE